MPCNSSYMEPHDKEVQISRVACLIDELNGKKKIDESHYSGYHPRVYCNYSEGLADQLVSELCSRLKTIDVTKCSLEMQMWWRDHQEADHRREKAEQANAQAKKEKKALERKKKRILVKLSPEDRRILGFE